MTMKSILTENDVKNFSDLDRMIKEPECKRMTSYSRSGLDKAEKENRFPKRVKIGPRAVAWRLSEVQAWIRGDWYPGWKADRAS
ncbi:AlpA family phage regulatory protein [Salmonella enterica]|nr:AlpA family phage regulatory protein [Salmonella enterica subsp. enterica serovar Banana]EDY8451000.1 AlpA family phage regulatory protein [Salmonella enterica subsp. enterica serovar Wangata]EGJ4670141.1 AlpA family phage regulatory protein [Salmonella enterica]